MLFAKFTAALFQEIIYNSCTSDIVAQYFGSYSSYYSVFIYRMAIVRKTFCAFAAYGSSPTISYMKDISAYQTTELFWCLFMYLASFYICVCVSECAYEDICGIDSIVHIHYR